MARRIQNMYALSYWTTAILNLQRSDGWVITGESGERDRVDIENVFNGERVGNLPRHELTKRGRYATVQLHRDHRNRQPA